MNTTNEEPKPADNMELLKQQAQGCGTDCSCHCGGASGKAKMLICGAVLLVAAVLVVKALTKSGDPAAKTPATGYAVPTADSSTPSVPAPTSAPDSSVGTMISALAELNTAAASSNAAFVYLPGNGADPAKIPAAALASAVRTLGAKGSKCAIFTLKPGSPDYANLGSEAVVPGVLVMVQGKGRSAVSGEITETKLVQGFVAASRAGGCGPDGCGPGGCE